MTKQEALKWFQFRKKMCLSDRTQEAEDIAIECIASVIAQEPRLVVKEDFVNADRWGYLPVYVEDRDGQMYWDCITDVVLGGTVSRFWTTKPTDEQRKAVKWNDQT